MFKKQDSAFWWTIDKYVKDNPEFKNLTIEQKKLIDKGYRLAYYGLFQYELYIGRELNDIDPSDIQEISNYIIGNFDKLAAFIKQQDNSNDEEFNINDEDSKQRFIELLDDVILPYISDHSFGNINSYNSSQEAISMITMQLAFKNEYDVNYENKVDQNKVFYSPVFPFLITTLVLDPTNIDQMYDNAKSLYTPSNINNAYNAGRMISNEESEYLFSSMDRLKDDSDFESMLHEFTKERWEQLDLSGRFRVVFQLSKYTAILLKENINSITMLEDGDSIYDLIQYYLPIILQSSEEFSNYRELRMQDNEKDISFLYPISFKDFDSSTIKEYFKKMKINKIKIDDDKLNAFRIGVIYSLSKLRLIYSLKDISEPLRNYFINKNKVALVNSLSIFDKDDKDFKKLVDYFFKYEDGFIDATSLTNIIKSLSGKKEDEQVIDQKLKPMVRIISYLIALDPSIVKKMDYSLEELIKYYLICFGPYKKTKIGYDKADIKDITDIVKKISKNLDKKKCSDDDYHSTFYLINKLINFNKKKHN